MDQKPLTPAVDPRRVNVLALPAPTTGLYLLFIAALLAVGLFVGSWMHNVVLGREWVQELGKCLALDLAQQQQCTAPLEIRRGLWSLAGAGVMAVFAVAVMFVVPLMIRRRRALQAPSQKHSAVVERFGDLASEAGLRRVPKLFIGPARMGDAFSFGRPGSTAVALPPKIVGLLVRPGPADGVILHEFAHIRHRDVELAWLARSSWYVTLVVLLVPVAGAIWEGPSLLPYYLWRAALLAVVVEIVTAALLRSREHDADLRAAQGSYQKVSASLGLLGPGTPAPGIRRLRMRHPTREARVAVLHAPSKAATSDFLRSLSAGALAGIVGPLVVGTATALLTGSGVVLGGIWASAAVTGSLLGFTVGLDLWRSRLAASLAEANPAGSAHSARNPRDSLATRDLPGVFRVAVGVAVGLALGQVLSFAGIGQDVSAPVDPLTLIAPIIAGLGTVFICAAFASMGLPLALLAKRPWHFWLPAALISSATFVVTTWMSDSLDLALTNFGWLGAALWIQYGYDEWPGIGFALVLGIAAIIAAIYAQFFRGREARGWMYFNDNNDDGGLDSQRRPNLKAPGSLFWSPLILGLVAGIAGSIFLVSQLLRISPIRTAEAASQADFLWVSTTVLCWASVSAVLCLVNPATGPATTFIAGPLTLALCAMGAAVFWLASTDSVPWDVLLSIWAPAMARGFAISLIVASLTVTLRLAVQAVIGFAVNRAARVSRAAKPSGRAATT
ncbi:M48 family metalloprotease [Paenarthrobacter sp. NPDC091669]|uniref:M48 family metalloprotease n=1 Tax=Paenarthrobacter sp. NPDC091669 TaxID=3364384 RepID=UPI0037FE53F0